MGVSYSTWLVYGIPAAQVFKQEKKSVLEPRFDPRTGQPVAPVDIGEWHYSLFGVEVSGDTPGDWEYKPPLEGSGLNVYTHSHYGRNQAEDYNNYIIGMDFDLNDENSITLIGKDDLHALYEKVRNALLGLGCGLEPDMYIVRSCG